MDNIQVPVNVDAVIEICIPEKIETMSADFFGRSNNLCSQRWHSALQQKADFRNLRCFEEESPCWFEVASQQFPAEVVALSESIRIDPRLSVLPYAIDDFLFAHRPQSRRPPSPWRWFRHRSALPSLALQQLGVQRIHFPNQPIEAVVLDCDPTPACSDAAREVSIPQQTQ
jgi:hypothetical protein